MASQENDYPRSQEEALTADRWRFHTGSVNPANCDFVYYRRKCSPLVALGPTDPALLRWTQEDASDVLAWHPVYAAFQRAHQLAQVSA